MNKDLSKAMIEAVSDDRLDANNPNYPTDPGVQRKHMCSRFTRCGTRLLYGPKYQGLFGGSAIETGENFRDAGFTVAGVPQSGDYLIKMVGSGGAGHIGLYADEVPGVGFNMVAENSSTSIGRVSGAKGYRSLGDFGHYDLIGRLPSSVQPEQTYRLFLNDKQIAVMPIQDGHAYLKASVWALALGFELGWDEDNHMVVFDSREMPKTTRIFLREDRAFVQISDLVAFSGLRMTVDTAVAKVIVTR